MLILIPSKNIYDKQNPKVRDNVIKRIEVGAVEVTPSNEYGTSVYNEKIIIKNSNNNSISNTQADVRSFFRDSWTLAYGIGISKTQITRIYCSGTIKIPKLNNNILINEILSKTNSGGNAQIKYSARCTKKTGEVVVEENLSKTIYNPNSGAARIEVSVSNNTINTDNRTFTDEKKGVDLPNTSLFEPKDSIYFTQSYTVENNSYEVTSTTNYPDTLTNLGSLNVRYNEETDKYEFDYTVLCGIGFDRLGTTQNSAFDIGNASDNTVYENSTIKLLGETEFYFPEQIEITVYGDTIGIDLTEKTVYINGEMAKKVHSVDGNELMQTSNYKNESQLLVENTDYWIGKSKNESGTYYYTSVHLYNKYPLDTYVDYTNPNGEKSTATIKAFSTTHSPAIESTNGYITINKVYRSAISTTYEYFEKTKTNYSKGIEAAIIRCDISDYYEYNETSDNFKGEKVIAIDNSTNKMSFKMYDQVIPMVYGADGKDRPISIYQDGTPKIFQVLGTNIFYDGAVWQELSLQEV